MAAAQFAPFPRNQPLPANPYSQLNNTPSFEAYEQCLFHEAEAQEEGNSETQVIYARCLGYLMSEAPDNDSRCDLAHEILECKGEPAKIDELAVLYINHLLRLFRQNKGPTPRPSDHPSRPSFEEHREFFGAAVTPAPRDHKTAKDSALRRDSYCCMVTGYADSESFLRMTPAEQQAFGVIGRELRITHYCHIFPPSTNWNLRPEENGHLKTMYSGSVWAIVSLFGKIDGLLELDGVNAHRLSNGLTLASDVHCLFDTLSLWFEEILGQANTYYVKTVYPAPSLNRIVTFATTTGLELPNPQYLRLHATVCRVAHMSGAAGYLDLFDRSVEKTKVLARDGSSADLLNTRLHQVCLTA